MPTSFMDDAQEPQTEPARTTRRSASVKKIMSIFVCTRVDNNARVLSQISNRQYPVCTESNALQNFERKLNISRDYSLRDRNNIIVMGDSLGDSGMANGCVNGLDAHILKIGFLNDHVEANLPAYMDAFDIVLMDNQTMHVPRNIVDLITQVQ